ncbi:hypothetical protein PYCCODRAFT_1394179 [Trametes coccinea BRFM310]|uniref:DUF1365-domain-containing protein n=1 Tax=Trametes coccinea (strain BRFM310) TaxID=1353009 RepID=A0A1Y2IHK2_TRAC3|nr:hypothetical protein PYCCODRAFT_1394179 [Trametes coccinea BRFM310]
MSTAIFASLAAAVVGALALSARRWRGKAGTSDEAPHRAAYILENTVTHARVLPQPSAHAFTYPTLAFLLSLNALEAHELDLGRGWLFGYGGTSWRLTGLRSEAYLLPDVRGSAVVGERGARALRDKLADVLCLHGRDEERVRTWLEEGDAWMLTMPSYLGYEGINPLTVYFCYGTRGQLEWVVLEIHNTFGEKHVHVLEPGEDEDTVCPSGFDHTWTFARDFHVSPFNDRTGFYVVSIRAPPSPRSTTDTASRLPKVRIHLHNASPTASQKRPSQTNLPESALGPRKLMATFSARRATPLTSTGLLMALARYPFALFLSFARILYHAWILHYLKRLDVFPRPDPKPATPGWGVFSRGPGERDGAKAAQRVSGGAGWQPEGIVEAYARGVVERFLSRRADELDIAISLMSGDPSVPPKTFQPSRMEERQKGRAHLAIHHAAPRFFTTLLLAPSGEHMLLLGRVEGLFRVNSESLFLRAFTSPASTQRRSCIMTQRLRASLLPRRFLLATGQASELGDTPHTHPLDAHRPIFNALAICALHLADRMEKAVFSLLRARFVPGLEPWGRWERAASAAQDRRSE